MKYYVGLDVSLEETSLCVVDEAGEVVREVKVLSEPDAIAVFLLSLGLRFERLGLEAGPLSQWLHDGLVGAGFRVICMETRHVKAALSAMRNKTDRNDARAIAQLIRVGLYREVHVKTLSSQEQRTLLTARKFVQRRLHDVENELRGLLRTFGLKVGRVSRRRFEGRVRLLVGDRAALLRIIEPLLRLRGVALAEFEGLHGQLLAMARQDPVCRRLMTVPGVGAVTALCFRATVDIPARFTKSKTVGAHFGLTSRKHQSGQVDRNGRISKCGDGMMRATLYEAANVMLTRTKSWNWLKAWAMQLAKTRGNKRAKVALARRLAVVLHRMWLDASDFRWTKEELA